MEGKGPGVPTSLEDVKPEQNTWWAARVLCQDIEGHKAQCKRWRKVKAAAAKLEKKLPKTWWNNIGVLQAMLPATDGSGLPRLGGVCNSAWRGKEKPNKPKLNSVSGGESKGHEQREGGSRPVFQTVW